MILLQPCRSFYKAALRFRGVPYHHHQHHHHHHRHHHQHHQLILHRHVKGINHQIHTAVSYIALIKLVIQSLYKFCPLAMFIVHVLQYIPTATVKWTGDKVKFTRKLTFQQLTPLFVDEAETEGG